MQKHEPKRAPQDSAAAQLSFCANGGHKCPHCGTATELAAGPTINPQGNTIRTTLECNNGHSVQGIYTVSHFEG